MYKKEESIKKFLQGSRYIYDASQKAKIYLKHSAN